MARYENLKIKLAMTKKAIHNVKEQAALAHPETKFKYAQKKKQLVRKLKVLINVTKAAHKIALKTKVALQRVEMKAQKQKVKTLQQKQNRLRKDKAKAIIKLQVAKQKIILLKSSLNEIDPSSPKAMKYKLKVKNLKRQAKMIQTRVQTMRTESKGLTKVINAEMQKAYKIKRNIIKANEAARCARLQKQLLLELMIAKKLKAEIARECERSTQQTTAAQLTRLQTIQHRINVINQKIVKTKAQLVRAPVIFKPKLYVDIKGLKQKMKLQNMKLRLTLKKIENMELKSAKLSPKAKLGFIDTKKVLEERAAYIKDRLQKVRIVYNTLKEKYAAECEARIKKEQETAKVYIARIETKLDLVKQQGERYKKLLEVVKSEAKVRAEAEKVKLQLLQSQSDLTKQKLNKVLLRLQKKARSLKALKIRLSSETKRMHKVLEMKAQDMIKKERAATLARVTQLKEKFVLMQKKAAAIKQAQLKAQELHIKNALASQHKAEQKKMWAIKKKLILARAKARSLKTELELRRKAITAEQKEAAMKKILMEREEKKRLAKLQIEWETEAKEDLQLSLQKLRAVYQKKIATLKKELAQLMVEKDEFTKALPIKFKHIQRVRMAKLAKGYEAKLQRLRSRIASIQKEQAAFKVEAAEKLNRKQKALAAKMLAKTTAIIAKLKIKLQQEKVRQQMELNRLTLKLKQKFIQEKLILSQNIANMKASIAMLKANALKKEAELQGKLAKAQAETEGLKLSLELEKKKGQDQEREIAKTKKRLTQKHKAMLASEAKQAAVAIAESKAKLAKLQNDFMRTKGMLLDKLQAAKQESASLSAALTTRKAAYARLQSTFKTTKAELVQKHKATLKEQQDRTATLKVEMTKQLNDCSTNLKAAEAESAKLKLKIKKKEEILKKLHDKKQKRSKAAKLIGQAFAELQVHLKKVADLESARVRTCSIVGTPGPALRKKCKGLQDEIDKLKAVGNKMQGKLNKLKEQYDAI